MQTTLYDLYQKQGKALPKTAEARFADPQFASAAKQAGVTQDQYKVNSGNASLNSQIASLYGKTSPSAPAPVNSQPQSNSAPTAPVPTTGYTPISNEQSSTDMYGNEAYNTTANNYSNYLNNPDSYLESQGIRQADFKNKAIAEMQAQIDSTNAMYANKLAESKRLGSGLLGSTGAIQARRGLLGSDFGEAQTADINQKNKVVYDNIELEKQAAISDIMNKAEQASTQRYTDARVAAESGLKSKLEFLKLQQSQTKTGASDAANLILSKGLNVSSMNPTELAQIAKGYGTNTSAITNQLAQLAYQSDQAKKKRQQDVQDALAKKGPISVAQGNRLYDPLTGKELAYNPKTYAPSSLPSWGNTTSSTGGLLAGVPQNIADAALSIKEGRAKLNEYPSALRLAINSAASKLYAAEGGNELAQTAYDAVLRLEKNSGFSGAVGTNLLLGLGKKIPGSASSGYLADMDQLKAALKLVNIKYLKGTGALSDAEGATLERAGTTLDPSLPEVDFKAELKRVKEALEKANNFANENKDQQNQPKTQIAPDGQLIEIVD